jgi:hypothetical protein
MDIRNLDHEYPGRREMIDPDIGTLVWHVNARAHILPDGRSSYFVSAENNIYGWECRGVNVHVDARGVVTMGNVRVFAHQPHWRERIAGFVLAVHGEAA